jgi:HEPN domain-containing protein
MIDRDELRRIAQARLEDAEVLLRASRYDGAIYVCGYAVELALKARICETLNWSGYPSTRAEFQDYQTLRTHDLNVLLRLSGIEDRIKTDFAAEWRTAATWNPEARYLAVGATSEQDAMLMIRATITLLRVL